MITCSKCYRKSVPSSAPALGKFLTAPITGLVAPLVAAGVRALGPADGPPAGRRDGDWIDVANFDRAIVGQSADRLRQEWRAIADSVADARLLLGERTRAHAIGAGTQQRVDEAQRHLDRVTGIREGFLGSFAVPRERAVRDLDAGHVPPIRGSRDDPGPFGWVAPALTDFRSLMAEIRRPAQDIVGRLAADRDRRLAEIDARRAGAAAAADQRAAFAGVLGPAALAPAGGPGAIAARAAAARAIGWGAGVGPIAVAGIPPTTERPRPEHVEMGIALRREFDPREELETYRRGLDAVRTHRPSPSGSGWSTATPSSAPLSRRHSGYTPRPRTHSSAAGCGSWPA
jgi:hypothetical protein